MSGPKSASLISPGEPAPYEEWWPEVSALPVLLVCDHASSRVPGLLQNLGVTTTDLGCHIALDIGAAALTRQLAEILQVPAVLSGYSRLVVDCNRHLGDPSAFPEVSDGVVIPGNQLLSANEQAARADALYWPYHTAISSGLDRLGPIPALVAIHSFTPRINARARPWHVGVLWGEDDRIAVPLLAALRADGRFMVGDNEPYSGRHPAGYTMDAHAESRGLPHVSIEVRQDLLVAPGNIREWAALLGTALRPILASRLGGVIQQHFRSADGNP